MTLSELMVSIGFDVDDGKLNGVQNTLNKISSSASNAFSNVTSGVNDANSASQNANSTLLGMIDTATSLATALGSAFAVKKIEDFAKSCTDAYTKVLGMQRKYNKVYGVYTDENGQQQQMALDTSQYQAVEADVSGLEMENFSGSSLVEYENTWAETMADRWNRNSNTIKKELADQQNLLYGFANEYVATGQWTEEQARTNSAKMAESIVKWSKDLAAFNGDAEDVTLQRMQRAIMGQAMSAKMLGAVLNDSTRDFAMEQLKAKGVVLSSDKFKDLSEFEKMQVRLQAIIQQSPDAGGMLEQLSGTYAGMTKSLAVQQEKLKEFLGEQLLPLSTASVKFQSMWTGFLLKLSQLFFRTEKGEGRIELMLNRINSVTKAIKEITEPFLEGAKKNLDRLVNALGGIDNVMNLVFPAVAGFAAFVVGLNLAVPFLRMVKAVTPVVLKMMPIFLAMMAIFAIAQDIVYFIEGKGSLMEALLENLGYDVQATRQYIIDFFSTLKKNIADGLSNFNKFFYGIHSGFTTVTAKESINQFLINMGRLLENLSVIFKNLFTIGKQVFSTIGDSISNLIQNIAGLFGIDLSGSFLEKGMSVGERFAKVLEFVSGLLVDITDKMKKFDIADWGLVGIGALLLKGLNLPGILGKFKVFSTAIGTMFLSGLKPANLSKTLVSSFSGIFGGLTKTLSVALAGIPSNLISGAIGLTGDGLMKMGILSESFSGFIEHFVNPNLGSKPLILTFLDAVKSDIDDIIRIAGGGKGIFKGLLDGLLGGLGGGASAIGEGAFNGLFSIFNTMSQKMPFMWTMFDSFKGAFSSIGKLISGNVIDIDWLYSIPTTLGNIGKLIGSAFTDLPILKNITGLFTPIVNLVTPIAAKIGTIFGGIFTKLSPVIGKLTPVFAKLGTTIGGFLQGAGGAFLAMSSTIAVVIGVVASLIAFIILVIRNFDRVKLVIAKIGEVFKPVFDGIKSVFDSLVNTIRSGGPGAFEFLKNKFNEVFGELDKKFRAACLKVVIWLNTIKPYIQMVVDFVSQLWAKLVELGVIDKIKTMFVLAFQTIISFIQMVMTIVVGIVAVVWNVLSTIIGFIAQFVMTLWNEHGQLIIEIISNIIEGVTTAVTGVIEVVKGVFDMITALIHGDFKGAWEAFKTIVQGAIDIVTGALEGVANAIRGIFDLIVGTLSYVGEGIGNAVGGIADKIASFLHFSKPDEGPLTDYDTWMPDMMQGMADSIDSNHNIIEQALTNLGNVFSKWGTETMPLIGKGIGRNICQSIADGITNSLPLISTELESLNTLVSTNIASANTAMANARNGATVNIDSTINNNFNGATTTNVQQAAKTSAKDVTGEMARAVAISN